VVSAGGGVPAPPDDPDDPDDEPDPPAPLSAPVPPAGSPSTRGGVRRPPLAPSRRPSPAAGGGTSSIGAGAGRTRVRPVGGAPAPPAGAVA
jgi:hypothetical protein